MLIPYISLFEIVVFSFITGNNDMHLKNFSLLKIDENWILAPAYDLLNVNLHLPEDKEESALTIIGKKSRLMKKDFIQLGEKFGLNNKQIENTLSLFHLKKYPTIISDGQRTNTNAQCKKEKYLSSIGNHSLNYIFVCLNFCSSWVARKNV